MPARAWREAAARWSLGRRFVGGGSARHGFRVGRRRGGALQSHHPPSAYRLPPTAWYDPGAELPRAHAVARGASTVRVCLYGTGRVTSSVCRAATGKRLVAISTVQALDRQQRAAPAGPAASPPPSSPSSPNLRRFFAHLLAQYIDRHCLAQPPLLLSAALPFLSRQRNLRHCRQLR